MERILLQIEFERKLKKHLNAGYGYTTEEISYMFEMDKLECISRLWKAKRHNILTVKVINVKHRQKVHWKLVTPRSKVSRSY